MKLFITTKTAVVFCVVLFSGITFAHAHNETVQTEKSTVSATQADPSVLSPVEQSETSLTDYLDESSEQAAQQDIENKEESYKVVEYARKLGIYVFLKCLDVSYFISDSFDWLMGRDQD